MNGGEVRFGFLGAGWIAHRALAPAVHAAAGARLQAVAARDAARGAELEPAGRTYTDYRALLADPDVDVVYISLSNDGHLPWILAALEAGKHVLCEKPLGLDPDEVRTAADAAQAADRLLVEAFMYRWHPRTARLEQLVTGGGLGEVRELEADFSFPGDFEGEKRGNYRLDPARGGGALYDVGCYGLSAAHLLLGPELEVERAELLPGPSGVDLVTTAWLAAAGPAAPAARALVRGGIALPERQVLRVTGAQAGVECAPGAPFTCWHEASALRITAADGATHEEAFGPLDPYRLMVEAVAARVRGEDAFVVDLLESARVASTLAAVRRAATVVDAARPPG